ncbi:hypothetical protein [Nocardioides daeguensis]|uniref:PPE domain-containing protein n=1 Tax=Nocardioides daeguensis TaxID=908359 RepID=A0ABP6VEL1_9ACTN|nr:hypothetical protein [Nocardioides daeguensis]MBV6729510.1 hypothetical protein [Nocardioides daeguensis]MCR1771717.1 hypothetical protein [Nocardioides daeguensis]
MTITLDVPYAVLKAARDRWDEAADELDGAWRRLAKVSTSDLSDAVAAAVTAFADPWVDELKVVARQAQGYADEFVFFRRLLVLVDRAQAERLRALLPWTERDAAVGEVSWP